MCSDNLPTGVRRHASALADEGAGSFGTAVHPKGLCPMAASRRNGPRILSNGRGRAEPSGSGHSRLRKCPPQPAHVLEEPPLISVALQTKQAKQQTVLVVDDEEAILGVCAVILERAGFRALKAKDSAEALRICTAHSGSIDALLTDLVLVPRGFRIASSETAFPQVHGHELAMRALTIRPDLRIGLMSGNPDKDLAGYGIKRGACPFLLKPFSMEQLVQFVRDVLLAEVGAVGA